MRVVCGLLLALAAAATLSAVCALTWPGLFELSPRRASITPASGSEAQAARQTAEASHVEHAPASPEVVVLAPRGGSAASPTWRSPWSDRLPLAQQLQRELARVGCYDGEINGVWTPATRRALKAFMDRVNAALPTEAPDRIQLALVEAARERVCGAACSAGETLAEGRCIPNVVLARRKFAPNALPANARADHGSGSTTAGPAPPLAADASRTGLVTGEQGLGQTAPSQTATGISTPGQAPATPHATARAAEAKRRRGQPGLFGLAIFKQFEKLGF
jgi:Putative peptidoglycan binding domain